MKQRPLFAFDLALATTSAVSELLADFPKSAKLLSLCSLRFSSQLTKDCYTNFKVKLSTLAAGAVTKFA